MIKNLLFLLVLSVSLLVEPNKLKGQEVKEATPSIISDVAEKEDYPSPMMMWRSFSGEVLLAQERYKGIERAEEERLSSSVSTAREERQEEIYPICIDAFQTIFGDDVFDDVSFLGHSTGQEKGQYVEVPNNFSCLPDQIKKCLRSEYDQEQIQNGCQRVKADLEKALSSDSLDLRRDAILSSFDQYCSHYNNALTRGAFLDFCKENNIVTPRLTSDKARRVSDESRGRYSLGRTPWVSSDLGKIKQLSSDGSKKSAGYGSLEENMNPCFSVKEIRDTDGLLNNKMPMSESL